MSMFINQDITDAGRLLLAKAQTGAAIYFTRIVMGDGFLPPDETTRTIGNVVHPVADISISRLRVNDAGDVTVGGSFSNDGLGEGFFYRELGLYATDADIGEILYCYGNAGELAEWIPSSGGASVVEKSIDIVTVIGAAANVTAEIPSGIAVTKEDLEGKADLVNGKIPMSQIPDGISGGESVVLAQTPGISDTAAISQKAVTLSLAGVDPTTVKSKNFVVIDGAVALVDYTEDGPNPEYVLATGEMIPPPSFPVAPSLAIRVTYSGDAVDAFVWDIDLQEWVPSTSNPLQIELDDLLYSELSGEVFVWNGDSFTAYDVDIDMTRFTAHIELTDNAHGATPLAQPSTLVARDADGRTQTAEPLADEDAANKAYVDNAVVEQIYTLGGEFPSFTVTAPDVTLVDGTRLLVCSPVDITKSSTITVQLNNLPAKFVEDSVLQTSMPLIKAGYVFPLHYSQAVDAWCIGWFREEERDTSNVFVVELLTEGTQWTSPAGLVGDVMYREVGGGGDGGPMDPAAQQYDGGSGGSGGGGGGRHVVGMMTIAPSTTVPYSIGARGTNHQKGGNTVFNGVVAEGGSPGKAAYRSGPWQEYVATACGGDGGDGGTGGGSGSGYNNTGHSGRCGAAGKPGKGLDYGSGGYGTGIDPGGLIGYTGNAGQNGIDTIGKENEPSRGTGKGGRGGDAGSTGAGGGGGGGYGGDGAAGADGTQHTGGANQGGSGGGGGGGYGAANYGGANGGEGYYSGKNAGSGVGGCIVLMYYIKRTDTGAVIQPKPVELQTGMASGAGTFSFPFKFSTAPTVMLTFASARTTGSSTDNWAAVTAVSVSSFTITVSTSGTGTTGAIYWLAIASNTGLDSLNSIAGTSYKSFSEMFADTVTVNTLLNNATSRALIMGDLSIATSFCASSVAMTALRTNATAVVAAIASNTMMQAIYANSTAKSLFNSSANARYKSGTSVSGRASIVSATATATNPDLAIASGGMQVAVAGTTVFGTALPVTANAGQSCGASVTVNTFVTAGATASGGAACSAATVVMYFIQ